MGMIQKCISNGQLPFFLADGAVVHDAVLFFLRSTLSPAALVGEELAALLVSFTGFQTHLGLELVLNCAVGRTGGLGHILKNERLPLDGLSDVSDPLVLHLEGGGVHEKLGFTLAFQRSTGEQKEVFVVWLRLGRVYNRGGGEGVRAPLFHLALVGKISNLLSLGIEDKVASVPCFEGVVTLLVEPSFSGVVASYLEGRFLVL